MPDYRSNIEVVNELGPSAFSLISTIYQSDLSFRLKNDCLCRILALRYNLDATSILLYDGESDKLVNRGSYIDEAHLVYMGGSVEEEEKTRHMLRYISFYDFLYHKYNFSGIPPELTDADITSYIQEFLSPSQKGFNYEFRVGLLNSTFVRRCHVNSIWLATNRQQSTNGSYLLDSNSFYNALKRKFKSAEQYIIGPDVSNLSGRVYWKSLNRREEENKYFFFDTDLSNGNGNPLPEHYNYFFSHLEEFCAYKFEGELNYCGIPLWANGRCLGVLRILTKPSNKDLFTQIERVKSMRHASEILSNFLEQNYAQEFVDGIDHDWDEDIIGNISQEEKKANDFCNSLRHAIDSFGCVLHLRAHPGNSPSIIGRSTDSLLFSAFVTTVLQQKNQDSFILNNQFNPLLSNLFVTARIDKNHLVEENYRLIGISLSLDRTSDGPLHPHYYYCQRTPGSTRESERVRETDQPVLFRSKEHPDFNMLFHPVVLRALKGLHIGRGTEARRTIQVHHILLMEIPAVQVDGTISFYNTANRPFSLPDVRFAYGEMKRLGLEISKVNQERVRNYKDISSSYFHDIKNILKISIAQSKLLDNAIAAHPEVGEATHLTNVLRHMYGKVSSFQKLAAYTVKTHVPKYQKDEWNIVQLVEKHCSRLSIIGNLFKATKVWFEFEGAKSNYRTRINQEVFELCFYNLLENAMKYSYGKESKNRIPGYSAQDEKTPGHVHVRLFRDKECFLLNFENWGCPIADQDKIFENGETPLDINLFLINENKDLRYENNTTIKLWQSSQRIGLYTTRKFIAEIGGHCLYSAHEDKITFTLILKKDE